jgi:hypothetical protein
MASNPCFNENQQIGHAMKGVDFPVRRKALLSKARENGASGDVLEQIEGLPDEEYDSATDVMRAIAKE